MAVDRGFGLRLGLVYLNGVNATRVCECNLVQGSSCLKNAMSEWVDMCDTKKPLVSYLLTLSRIAGIQCRCRTPSMSQAEVISCCT